MKHFDWHASSTRIRVGFPCERRALEDHLCATVRSEAEFHRIRDFFRLETRFHEHARDLIGEVVRAVPATAGILDLDVQAIGENGPRLAEIELLDEFLHRGRRVRMLMAQADEAAREMDSFVFNVF